ncbi:DUF3124 domain-containing protein [Longimicrobium sp.]|uniref:DUF3124 domain-containing protein n=1 Tax=Longimicrobium sp. TaxID=2029185 RepID=UPI002D08C46E|nr:DUF3124 domain-containing protein [Longimicrobium sp.]HSU17458.1 DUF3124 domain-containing protein [Longimicrobium sp.]
MLAFPFRALPAAALALLLTGCGGERERPRQDGGAPPAPPRAVRIPHRSDFADSAAATVRQVVYVPVYTHVYAADAQRRFALTAMLSVRNTDPDHPLVVTAVQLYATDGKFLREYLRAPLRLAPLATAEYVLPEGESAGSGANFMVEWTATQKVTEPVIEAVMVSVAGTQGLSFVSVGRPLVRR